MLHTETNYEERVLKLYSEIDLKKCKHPDLDLITEKIIKNMPIYTSVRLQTNVPGALIGAIHFRECSLQMKCHLFNGDPLSARTVHVPSGLPATGKPPFTWVESAVAALIHQNMHRIKSWNIVMMLTQAERYNGLGYRVRGVLSPYVWSQAYYCQGLYENDGNFSAMDRDKRPGVALILKSIEAKGVNLFL